MERRTYRGMLYYNAVALLQATEVASYFTRWESLIAAIGCW